MKRFIWIKILITLIIIAIIAAYVYYNLTKFSVEEARIATPKPSFAHSKTINTLYLPK